MVAWWLAGLPHLAQACKQVGSQLLCVDLCLTSHLQQSPLPGRKHAVDAMSSTVAVSCMGPFELWGLWFLSLLYLDEFKFKCKCPQVARAMVLGSTGDQEAKPEGFLLTQMTHRVQGCVVTGSWTQCLSQSLRTAMTTVEYSHYGQGLPHGF
jgi:hypothetical protein